MATWVKSKEHCCQSQRHQKKMKSGGLNDAAVKIWLIFMVICALKRAYMYVCGGAAHATMETNGGLQLLDWFLYVVKLSHAATTTGYCTTCKCIASLLAFISLFIACDVTRALKWGGSAPPPPVSDTTESYTHHKFWIPQHTTDHVQLKAQPNLAPTLFF